MRRRSGDRIPCNRSGAIEPEDYSFDDGRLTIPNVPDQPFVLETRCRLDPYSNSSLEGLYASGGLLSTQCEAEGFRRISLHPDRPDVLSRWQVRIEASRSSCPVLLSNGNACLLYTSPSPRDAHESRMPSSA